MAGISGSIRRVANSSCVPPRRTTKPYRPPTPLEREFLRIVTFGNAELERQIQACEIADYDVTGWCDVHILHGPPSPDRMVDGPTIDLTQLRDFSVAIAWPDVPETTFLVSAGKVVEVAPRVSTGAPRVSQVEIIMWATDDGMLYAVEVISYGDGYLVDPYRLFVDVEKSKPNLLQYATVQNGYRQSH